MSQDNGGTLPKGWAEAPIEDLFWPLEDGRTLHQGWSPQCEKTPAPTHDDWGVLKTTAIQAGAFFPQHNKHLPQSLTPRPQIEVKSGDLLITCAGPRVRCGVACLIRNTRPRLMMSGKMYRFRVSPDYVDPRFLEAYLLTSRASAAIDKMKTGGSDSGLNLTHDRFRPLPVPVAPLKEQRRIMDLIDELFSDLDAGIATLERVQAKLKRYRTALLKAAMEGTLTAEWRAQHPAIEPASKLLARIRAERRRLWEEAQLDKFKVAGKEPLTNWKAGYKEPPEPVITDLPKLPPDWCWTTAEQISDPRRSITYGVIKLGSYQTDGVPTLRSSNVRHLQLDLSEVKRISPSIAKNYSRTFLSGGEILITVRGTLGGVVEAPAFCIGYNVSREVAVIAPVISGLASAVTVFIGSPFLQIWLTKNSRGITYQGVNIEALKQLPIPLAPLTELAHTAELGQGQLSVIDHLEVDLDAKLKSAQALRQSILRNAFEGKLVPQDPNDEPASELLKRIAVKREQFARAVLADKKAKAKPKTARKKAGKS